MHIPELPLAGSDSTMLGLSLWQNLPVAASVETAVMAVGLWIYLRTVQLSQPRRIALVFAMLIVTVMSILGPGSKSAPPSTTSMAGMSLITILLLIWFATWIERREPRIGAVDHG